MYLEYSKKAINAFCLGSRISSAASLAKECSEKLEEDHDYEEAIKFYEKAAELYQMEE
jgi:TPR repeat protein